MKELTEVIVKALVDSPDEVVITEKEGDSALIIQIQVSPDDMGKVIGKQGRIAKALRAVVKAAATKDNKKVLIDIG
jgi:predicted RNA-binding protein YlqC (UPF0109 family)